MNFSLINLFFYEKESLTSFYLNTREPERQGIDLLQPLGAGMVLKSRF